MVELPRYVAFKGQNGKFLAPHNEGGHVYLQFNESEFASPNARHEVVPVGGGNVQIVCLANNKYWRRSPNWIWPDADHTAASNEDCLFQPVGVDSKTVALKSVANNAFLIPLTADRKEGCLNASVSTLTTDTRMTVVEPVLKRRVHSVVYDVDKADVRNSEPMVLGTRKAANSSPFKADVAMSFSYTQTTTSSWSTGSTISVGVETSITAEVPLVAEASVGISVDRSVTTEVGQTLEESQTLVDTYTVKDLPPKGSVTVKLHGTRAECNVPFSYTQVKSSKECSAMASTRAPISPLSTGNPPAPRPEYLSLSPENKPRNYQSRLTIVIGMVCLVGV